tara:strand:- start:34 stop:852 length:819 start_codon:yes stop_codon:yes gene_type:complete
MNILFSIDDYAANALYTTINSIIINCSNINMIKFYILVNDDKEKYILNINKYFTNIKFQVLEFNGEIFPKKYNILKKYIKKYNYGLEVHHNIMNYARIFYTDIFDIDGVCLHLDTDIIVKYDILKLLDYKLTDEYPCRAVLNRTNSHFKFPKSISEINFILDENYIGFNAGVYLFNANYWKKNNLTLLCIKILNVNLKKSIMNIGTQPLINLIFYNKVKKLNSNWNVSGAGWHSGITENDLQKAYIIHWSGQQKPWLKNGLWKNYWNKYRIS